MKPLRIDTVAAGTGLIGMTLCPGRNEYYEPGTQRNLDEDLRVIADWGAVTMVSLIEDQEFEWYGVKDLPLRVRELGLEYLHLPIVDLGVPCAAFEAAWRECSPRLHGRLQQGGRILLHCYAGLGRTGTIAARLLVETGMDPAAAIAAVRAARPGTIQTFGQELYVREGAREWLARRG